MPDEINDKAFVATLKADLAQAVSLYFAPVRAVVKEFNKAIAANSEDKKLEHHGQKAA